MPWKQGQKRNHDIFWACIVNFSFISSNQTNTINKTKQKKRRKKSHFFLMKLSPHMHTEISSNVDNDVCAAHTLPLCTLMQTGRLYRSSGRGIWLSRQLSTWMIMCGTNRGDKWACKASDLSIRSCASGLENVLNQRSRGGLPTAPRSRNNLLCCASPACCLQNRSCRIVFHKGAGSSHALKEREARQVFL